MNTTGTGNISTSDTDRTVDRAASKAHETVDRVAASVGPALDRVRSAADETSHKLHSSAHDLMETRDQWMNDMRSYVKERPLTTLGITAVVALLVGRFWAK